MSPLGDNYVDKHRVRPEEDIQEYKYSVRFQPIDATHALNRSAGVS